VVEIANILKKRGEVTERGGRRTRVWGEEKTASKPRGLDKSPKREKHQEDSTMKSGESAIEEKGEREKTSANKKNVFREPPQEGEGGRQNQAGRKGY